MSEGAITVHGTLQGELAVQATLSGVISNQTSLVGILQPATGYFPQVYAGPYEVTSKARFDQLLNTGGLLMADNMTVFKVPYYETSNLYDGLTVFIAEDNNG